MIYYFIDTYDGFSESKHGIGVPLGIKYKAPSKGPKEGGI